MDIQNLHWLTEMQKFHESIKNIEVIVTNVTDGIFNEAGNLNEAIEAYAALFNYTKRDTLEPLFSKKLRFVRFIDYKLVLCCISFSFFRFTKCLRTKYTQSRTKWPLRSMNVTRCFHTMRAELG